MKLCELLVGLRMARACQGADIAAAGDGQSGDRYLRKKERKE